MDTATEEVEERSTSLKKLNRFLHKTRIQDSMCDLCYATDNPECWSHSILVLPVLLQDITEKADKWGKAGRIAPFTDVADVSLLCRMSF